MSVMNKLPHHKRVQIVSCLVEGNSIRATTRMTGAAKNTVVKLLIDMGHACRAYQDAHLRNRPSKRIQVDEIWSFCYAKQKNLPPEKRGIFGYGDVWTWVAICADTKIVPCWLVGGRDAEFANFFIQDLSERLANRVQLTSDGHHAYLDAVERAFGADVEYAMLVKMYGTAPEAEKRYSPVECVGARRQAVNGKPNKRHISTSYIERQNLNMRMSMRRFTRLTNAFSKKVENLEHAVSLHYMYYNFVRLHQAHRLTPAMAAGVTDRLWEIDDIVKMADEFWADERE